MAACACSVGNTNTGELSCKGLMGIARKLIVVNKYDSTGARNGIDVSGGTTLDQAYVDALINQTDTSKRWYPTPLLDNVEDLKGDSLTETLNSSEELFISKGIRTFIGVMVQETPKMLGVLDSMRCVNNAVYIIDKEGKLIGEMSADGNTLYPVDVSQATWDAILIKTTDTTVQKIQLKFAFAQEAKDENLNYITPAEFDNVEFLTLNGLLDLTATFGTTIATKTIVTLNYVYGTAVTRRLAENFLLADFYLYNNTTSAVVTIDSITEVSGVYDLNHAAGVTATDVLELNMAKDGFTRDSLGTVIVA